MRFPTLRFLRASQQKVRRRTRLEALLLLLLRLLAIAALVLLFAPLGGAAAQEVLDENMGDELFARIRNSAMESMSSSSSWLTASEGVYRSQRDRVLG